MKLGTGYWPTAWLHMTEKAIVLPIKTFAFLNSLWGTVMLRAHHYDCIMLLRTTLRLEDVVNRMFERCREDKAFKQGLGMALECRRLDMVKTFIGSSEEGLSARKSSASGFTVNRQASEWMCLKALSVAGYVQ
eukprot:6458288-Amphidinium_carterae.4